MIDSLRSVRLSTATITTARVSVPHRVTICFLSDSGKRFYMKTIEIYPTRLSLLVKPLEELSKLAYEQKFTLLLRLHNG